VEDEWIEVGELMRATGISDRTLARWRDAGLIPRPQTMPRAGGGSVSKYPPGTLVQMRRVQELERDGPRSIDAWLLALWIEGYTVDIRPAVTRVFSKWLKVLADEEKVAKAADAISDRKARALRGGRQRLLNRMTARVVGLEEWSEFVRWVLAVAVGVKPEVSLHDQGVEPAPLPALLKIGGLPKDWGPPADNLSVEQWPIAFLRDVLATTGENEMERVRLVFVRLARLAAAADVVSLAALPRHARRTLAARGVKVTQDTIALLLDMWRDTEIRLTLVSGIALILRGASEKAEEWLSLAEAAVAMLPKGAAERPDSAPDLNAVRHGH
jgi:hypothetical protein